MARPRSLDQAMRSSRLVRYRRRPPASGRRPLVRPLVHRVEERSSAPDDEVHPGKRHVAARSQAKCVRRRKKDDGLVRRRSVLRQEEMRAHALAAIRGVECDGVLPPDLRLFGRLDDGVQRRAIVGVLPSIHLEDVIADRFLLSGVTNERLDPDGRGHGRRQRPDVFRKPEAVARRPLERPLRIVVREHVPRLVPCASQEKSAVVRFGPAPFLDVARHVVGAERAQAGVTADRRRALSAEVADREDVGEAPQARRTVPVMDRGQALAGERRVRRRLVPAHASDRKLRLTVGIRSRLPRRGPRPSGGVTKSLDGLFPRHGPFAFDERLPPIVAPTIPALIDELLELPVGDLESIDPVIVELADQAEPNGIAASDHAHHARWHRVHRIQPVAQPRRGSGAFDRLKACLGDPHSEETAWNPDALERRPAQGKPARRGRPIRGKCHVGARRVGGHDRRDRHVEPQLAQVRIIGQDVQRLTREKERLDIVTMIRESLNLGRGNGARPASAGCDHAPSPAPGRDREDHEQHGHHHHRPAEERPQAGWRRQVPRPDDRVEGGHEIGGRRKPVVRGFRQAPTHDVRQSGRYVPDSRPRDPEAAASRRRPGSRACCPP